jgi:hypothetical protein
MVAVHPSGVGFITLFVGIFSGTFGLIGLVFLIVGLAVSAAERRRRSLCTAYAEGVVGAFQAQPGTNMVRLVYSFPIDGRPMQSLSKHAFSAPKLLVGQKVHVHYDPQNVGNLYVEEENPRGPLVKVFTILGGVFLGIALLSAAVILGFAR